MFVPSFVVVAYQTRGESLISLSVWLYRELRTLPADGAPRPPDDSVL